MLLQRFLTGLRASISRQLLLRCEAIQSANEVEYALGFDRGRTTEPKDQVNLVQPPVVTREVTEESLQSTLDEMTKRARVRHLAPAPAPTVGRDFRKGYKPTYEHRQPN